MTEHYLKLKNYNPTKCVYILYVTKRIIFMFQYYFSSMKAILSFLPCLLT